MKIALVYNYESRDVINERENSSPERISFKIVERIRRALESRDHRVELMEADKNLIQRLESFMPRRVKGEQSGLVFNVAYGLQGQARYTHVPSILEMLGLPYVGSGPLAQSLALDKWVTKTILRDFGIETPVSAVLEEPDGELPALEFPVIMKPKSGAVSSGLRVVHDENELRKGADHIFEELHEPVIVERYIEGREINVGLLGNDPPLAFPPLELDFGTKGPRVYTSEDKTGGSGRRVRYVCPAKIDPELAERARETAIRSFTALGCCDCARVDMRIDSDGRLYVLEVNSIPSLGSRGSYPLGAQKSGLSFDDLIQKLVESAWERHFGAESPAKPPKSPKTRAKRRRLSDRDQLESRLEEWVGISSRTGDRVGIQNASQMAHATFEGLGLKKDARFGNGQSSSLWQTSAGLEGGTLAIANLDVPVRGDQPRQPFRREPEWLFGEGIATSRAAIVALEFALQLLRDHGRSLQRVPLGILLYSDEGADAQADAEVIRRASGLARCALVLDPVPEKSLVLTRRGGENKYGFRSEIAPRWLSESFDLPDIVSSSIATLQDLVASVSRAKDTSLRVLDLETERLPGLCPHQVDATLLLRYRDAKRAAAAHERLQRKNGEPPEGIGIRLISERPAVPSRPGNERLARKLTRLAAELELKLEAGELAGASVAGLVPGKTACVSGLGPFSRDVGTPEEAVHRLSLMQRTLLLARMLNDGRAFDSEMMAAS